MYDFIFHYLRVTRSPSVSTHLKEIKPKPIHAGGRNLRPPIARSYRWANGCRRSALKFLLYLNTNFTYSRPPTAHYSYDALSVARWRRISTALWRRTTEAPLVGHVETEREIVYCLFLGKFPFWFQSSLQTFQIFFTH